MFSLRLKMKVNTSRYAVFKVFLKRMITKSEMSVYIQLTVEQVCRACNDWQIPKRDETNEL